MTHITRVMVHVELSNGDLIEMSEYDLSPAGDNPRFLTQQLNSGVSVLTRRLEDAFESYGAQIQPVKPS